jgi:hypothetical protein
VIGLGVLGTHAAPIRGQAASVTCCFRRGVRGMRCNLPSPRPVAFPPPSPPPTLLGIVRGFLGTMRRPTPHPRACPSFGCCLHGPVRRANRTRMRSPRFRTKDFSTCMGSPTARGSSSASHLRGEDVAFSLAERDRHLGIRPVSLLDTQPMVSPDRGRDAGYPAPPAQIRTGPIKAYGSHLGW